MSIKDDLEAILRFHKNFETSKYDLRDERLSKRDLYDIGRGDGELDLATRLLKDYFNK